MTSVELALPKSIFSRWSDEGRNKKSVLEELLHKKTDLYSFTSFKFEQKILPDNSETRKLNRACPSCFPNHSCQFDDEIKTLGIKNIFHIETENDNQPFLVRRLASWCSVWKTAGSSAKQTPILDRKKIVEDAIDSLGEKCTEEQKQTLVKLSKDFYIPFCGFWGTIACLRIIGWIVRKLLSNIFDSVCVHQGEMELVERAHQTGLPVIYIPLYRSALDPIILFFTLQSHGMSLPYFFSTQNQRYWGKFIGGIGFQNNKNLSEEQFAKNALGVSWFRNVLRKRASVVLNLEQQRTRSGKPSTELYGMEILNILHNAWMENEAEDAYIVPLNVSYEHLPEHINESAWNYSAFKLIVKCVGRSLGFVRVNFGQPFTLREFKFSMKSNSKFGLLLDQTNSCAEAYSRTFLGSELCWDSTIDPALSSSLSSLYNLPYADYVEEQQSLFLDSLAFHSVFASMYSSTIMSTHLVAFLLLKKFRYGVRLDTLFSEVQKLQAWLRKYDKDVGFSGPIEAVVFHALTVLGTDTVQITRTENCVQVNPILSSPSLDRLGYYSNIVMPFLALEAVVAVAVFSIVGNKLATTMSFENIDIKINDDTLIRETRKVYWTFVSEFFLHSPCLTTVAAIRLAYNRMDKFLTAPDRSRQRPRKNFEADLYDENSDEDTNRGDVAFHYKIINSKESYDTLFFLRGLLVPYLEIYAQIALELQNLDDTNGEKPQYDFEFMEKVLKTLKLTFPKEQYGELLTLDTLKNALYAFESHGFIYFEVNQATKLKTIYLSDVQYSKKQLREVSNDILHYVTF